MDFKYLLQKSILSVLLVLGLGFFMSSCNDPTLIGTSLFDEDNININFTDTFDVSMKNVKGDSSVYSDRRVYFVGHDDSSLFGSRDANLYFDVRRVGNAPKKYNGATIDGMWLSIAYDTVGVGFTNITEQSFELHRLNEIIPDTATTKTNLSYESELLNIGNNPTIVTPKPLDSLNIEMYRIGSDTLIRVKPQLRIEIDPSFYQEFVHYDTMSSEYDSIFNDQIKGFYLTSTNSQSLVAFKFSSTNYISVNYNIGDTVKYTHTYPIGIKRFNNFNHDYNDATISDYLATPDKSDEVLFVEGFAGSNLEIDLSSIANYKNQLLNYAELEFYVDESYQSNNLVATNLIALIENDEGRLAYSLDALNGLAQSNFGDFHDGKIDVNMDLGIRKYKIILTAQINEFLQDDSLDKKIIISVLNKSSRSNRVVMYGPNHSKYPAKLRAIFTTP